MAKHPKSNHNPVEAVRLVFWRWFHNLPIQKKQLVGLFASEVISMVGLVGIGAYLIVSGVRTIVLKQAQSELAVTEINYNLKINQMGFGFRGQSDNQAIITAAKIHASGESLNNNKRKQVKYILQNEINSRDIEYATLVGKDLRIIVNANANRTGEIFNPKNLVSKVLANPRQIKTSELVSASELVKEYGAIPSDSLGKDALIRYTVTPVKEPQTQQLLGILVSGDIINGKQSLVSDNLMVLGGGYNAIYLRQPTGKFTLVLSQQDKNNYHLAGHNQYNQNQHIPNLPLPDSTILSKSVEFEGQPVTQRMQIGSVSYTVAAKTINNFAGEPVAVLVRGTPENAINMLLREHLRLQILVSVLALAADVALAMLLAQAIIKPIERLQQTTQEFAEGNLKVRAEILTTDEVGKLALAFNQMAYGINIAYDLPENSSTAEQSTLNLKLQQVIWERQQAEAALQNSKQRYASLVAAAPVGIFRMDTQGKYVYANEHWFQITGVTPQCLYKKERFQQLPNVSDTGRQAIEEAGETEGFYIEVSASGLLGVWELDNPPQSLDKPARQLTPEQETLMSCLSCFTGIHPVDRDRILVEWERTVEINAPFRSEYRFVRPNGTITWVFGQAVAEKEANGSIIGYIGTITDITEQKQAELERKRATQALKRLNQELEHRVEQRTAALRQTNEELALTNANLARATSLKDEFLASMSHELRTPLNSILGLSEALQEEVYGSLTDRQQRSLKTIEQSGNHLLALINDILDLAKIEAGKMELQIASVGVQRLCDSSLNLVRQQAYNKNIELSCELNESLGEIKVDERRMRQVLLNLLSNAVKFTPSGGSVTLKIEGDSDQNILSFTVIDTGIGIAPENLDKLFQSFVQIDSSLSRRYAGTGLGLALARGIAEMHGGSVKVESEVGKGSRFSVMLPWQQEISRESVKMSDDACQLQGAGVHESSPLPILDPQVLVIEDSTVAAEQVTRYLEEIGVQSSVYTRGKGAIEEALRLNPDVIILDLQLPEHSGWQVLSQLKAQSYTKEIPVLVVSVVDEKLRALAMGAAEYLVKPLSREKLHSALGKIWPEVEVQATISVGIPKQQQPPLILVAEDNETNIYTLCHYLPTIGYRLSLAQNGREAIIKAKQQQPRLILMDLQMPEMDGLEAMVRIRADRETAAIPIIALTALAMPGDRDKCLAAGANDYMTKPVSLKNLANTIKRILFQE
ncbi:MAG: response regulator [Symploca sp. SIO2E9]|nr:response regulator [Symploca sp. SIO2E9]